MPRLPTTLIRKASAANPNLAALLPTCRDLRSASNELRWLTEHVYASSEPQVPTDGLPHHNTSTSAALERRLSQLCRERGRGVPLQYLLGTEYFGDLKLACARGVLIPRPETADIVIELAHRLRRSRNLDASTLPRPLRVLDLCTGSGCMSFLLHAELAKHTRQTTPAATALGLDISPRAVRLARHNRERLGLGPQHARFAMADVLGAPSAAESSPPVVEALLEARGEWRTWDVVLANPPYISQAELGSSQVERSVRAFEPRHALVPPSTGSQRQGLSRLGLADADVFYPRILDIALWVGARVVLMEAGGPQQVGRVRDLARRSDSWDSVSVWTDGQASTDDPLAGRERAIVCSRGDGTRWIQE